MIGWDAASEAMPFPRNWSGFNIPDEVINNEDEEDEDDDY